MKPFSEEIHKNQGMDFAGSSLRNPRLGNGDFLGEDLPLTVKAAGPSAVLEGCMFGGAHAGEGKHLNHS